MEYVLLVLLVLVFIRNFRKDRSDGRDPLGGSRGGAGTGREVHHK